MDVEAESAHVVSARLGFGSLGKERPDVVVEADVCCGIGARVSPDRRLVDVNDVVDVFDALEPVMIT
jgi:hypothetical protein